MDGRQRTENRLAESEQNAPGKEKHVTGAPAEEIRKMKAAAGEAPAEEIRRIDQVEMPAREMTLGHWMRMVNISTDKYFHLMKDFSGDGMSKAQGPLMGYLVEHRDDVIFQKDIEKEFHISGATVSNMLSSMEKSGLIERVQMEGDARLRRIIPTDAGIQREFRVRKQILRLEEQMVNGFSEQEKERLMDYMVRVAGNIGDLCSQVCGDGEMREHEEKFLP